MWKAGWEEKSDARVVAVAFARAKSTKSAKVPTRAGSGARTPGNTIPAFPGTVTCGRPGEVHSGGLKV